MLRGTLRSEGAHLLPLWELVWGGSVEERFTEKMTFELVLKD